MSGRRGSSETVRSDLIFYRVYCAIGYTLILHCGRISAIYISIIFYNRRCDRHRSRHYLLERYLFFESKCFSCWKNFLSPKRWVTRAVGLSRSAGWRSFVFLSRAPSITVSMFRRIERIIRIKIARSDYQIFHRSFKRRVKFRGFHSD